MTTFANNLGRTSVASNKSGNDDGSTRRQVLECMTWAGTGILWTVSGGVPKSLSLLGSAEAATAAAQSFKSRRRPRVWSGIGSNRARSSAVATANLLFVNFKRGWRSCGNSSKEMPTLALIANCGLQPNERG